MSRISDFTCPTHLVFGENARSRISGILDELEASRILLIADPAMIDSEILHSYQDALRGKRLEQAIFSEIHSEPTDRLVNQAWQMCREFNAQAVMAVGGGSAIDIAKAVCILMTNGGRIADYHGIERFHIRPLPLIATPTTAGTGSEVSGAAVITDTDRQVKLAIRHAAFCPAQYAILDPIAVSTLPARLAAHAGIDAFTHAFESYISKLANPFTDALNLQAMALIAHSIRRFYQNRQDIRAAQDMQVGSSMAAMSFGVTGTGNVHCMALALGAVAGLPHGLSVALCLPAVAQFNAASSLQRFARVASVFNPGAVGLPAEQAAQQTVTAIRNLCADVGIPAKLSEAGVQETDLPKMAELCIQADYNRWNPRQTLQTEFLALYQSIY
ncbi:iron-containing alcohol dehydrogenase [Castellaniella sp. WN]